MQKRITIVTAFFRINRKNWQGFERSDEQYFEHFKVWARVKNKIVAYVETEEMRRRILSYRLSFSSEENTVVYVIPDCLQLAPDLLAGLKTATENPVQRLFRLYNNNPEAWNPTYNYVMLLKVWCVCDAIRKGVASDLVAWVDFGYNHGGDPIDKTSNFDFEWSYDFPDKINLFTIQDLDSRPIFEIILSMDTYIMGGIIVGIDYLWNDFWNLMKQSVSELISCGLADDDQNVLLMAYRKKPEIFALHKSFWSVQMKQFGGDHLRWSNSYLLRTKDTTRNRLLSLARVLKHKKACFAYSFRIYKYLSKIKIH